MGLAPTPQRPEPTRPRIPRLGLLLVYPGLLLSVLYVTVFLVGNSRTARLLAQDALNSVVPGRFVLGEVRLDDNLTSVAIFGVDIYGPRPPPPPLSSADVRPGDDVLEMLLTRLAVSPGDRVIRARAVYAKVSPFGLLLGEVVIPEAVVVAPDVLIDVDAKGAVGLVAAFTDVRSSDPRDPSARPPDIKIEAASIVDARVLVSVASGLAVRLDGVNVDRGSFALLDDSPFIAADVRAASGWLVVLPELFGLVDPRATDVLRDYRRQRRHDPWGAVREARLLHLEPRYGDEYGALVVPLGVFGAEDFAWENDAFTVASFGLTLAGENLRGEGRLALSDDKTAELAFDASARLTLAPGSPLVAYFTGDALRAGVTGVPDGRLQLEATGSLAEVAAELHLELRDGVVGDWPFERLALGVQTEAGQRFETGSGGLRLQVGRALLQGTGWLDPFSGDYAFDLWLDDLPSEWLLGPFASDVDPEVIGGLLQSEPDDPTTGTGAGLTLAGNLDAKRLGDLTAARFAPPSSGAPPPDLAVLEFSNLSWRRRAPALVPVTEVTATGAVALGPDGRLRLSGRGGTGRLDLDAGRESVDAVGTVDLLTETLDNLRVTASTNSLARVLEGVDLDGGAQATVRLDGPLAAPTVRVQRLSIADLAAGDLRAGTFEASGEVGLGGPLPSLRGGSLSARDVQAGPLAVAQATASVAFQDGRLHVDESSLETEYGKIDVDGDVTLFDGDARLLDDPRLDLTVSTGALDLGALAPDLSVAGAASVDARVTGTTAQPTVEGSLEVTDAIALDEWIDSLEADFSYSPRGLDVPRFEMAAAGGRLDGSLRLDRNLFPQSGQVWLRGLDLGELRALSALPVAIGGRPEIYLELVPPDAITAPAGLPDLAPGPGYPDIQGSVIVRDLTLDGRNAGVVALAVDTYGGEVRAVGRLLHELETEIAWPLDGSPVRLTSRFDRVPLLQGDTADEEGSMSRGEVSGGRLDAEIRVGGWFDLVADLGIESFWIETAGRRFEAARPLHLSYAVTPNLEGGFSQYLSVDQLSFGSDQHFLEVTGGVRDWDILNLTVSGEAPVSLATLLEEVAEARGVLGVDLSLGGTFEEPEAVGQIGFFDAAVTPRGLVEPITIDRGRLQILEPVVDSDTGDLVQTLRVDPRLPLEGQALGGAYSLSGQARLRRFQPLDATLELDATGPAYRLPGEASVTLSRADLTLDAFDLGGEGSPDLFLSGSLFVEEGLYFRDYGSDTVLAGTVVGLFQRQGVERYVAPIWEQVPALADLELNVRIQAPNNFRVRNTVLGAKVDLELRLDLSLTGTLTHPQLSGEIDVVDGNITFRNRTFEIQECRLEFAEGQTLSGVPVPTIEGCIAEARIEARGRQEFASRLSSTIQDFSIDDQDPYEAYTVRVTVSGRPPDNLDLVLESVNASLDQRDILALIFTGQTFDTLTTAAGAGQPGLELVTAELLSFAQSYLQETLSVDEIVVTPSTGGDGTVIQVSDRVSRRITVDVDATILSDEENQQSVRGQITLFDWMLLEVFGRSDAENNVEGGGRIRLRFEL